MKVEIPNKIPDHFVENWPGKFEVFSQYEDILGIPHVVYLVTLLKRMVYQTIRDSYKDLNVCSLMILLSLDVPEIYIIKRLP